MLKLRSITGLFFLLTLLLACKKDDDKKPADSPASVEKGLPVYFKGTINNEPVVLESEYQNHTDSVSNSPGGGALRSSSDTVTQHFSFNSTMHDQRQKTQKFITVYVAHYYRPAAGVYFAGFEKVFTPGSRPYKFNLAYSLGHAAAIQYRDENNVYWSTAKDYIYAQTINIPKVPSFAGQSFELVRVEERPELIKHPRDTKHVLANLKFSCYLYNAIGDSIHFQNAEFQGVFKDINP